MVTKETPPSVGPHTGGHESLPACFSPLPEGFSESRNPSAFCSEAQCLAGSDRRAR